MRREKTLRYMNAIMVPVDEGISKIIDGLKAAAKYEFGSNELPQDFADALAVLEKSMRSTAPDVVQKMAEEIEAAYTEEEIDALTAFEESPIGKRRAEVTPSLMNKLQQTSDAWTKSAMASIQDEWAKLLGTPEVAADTTPPAEDPTAPSQPARFTPPAV